MKAGEIDGGFARFQELYDAAEINATGQWEENFIKDMGEKLRQYGDGMFVSDKQMAVLNRIANGTDETSG